MSTPFADISFPNDHSTMKTIQQSITLKIYMYLDKPTRSEFEESRLKFEIKKKKKID